MEQDFVIPAITSAIHHVPTGNYVGDERNQIQAYVCTALLRDLDRLCQFTDVSRSEMIRQLLDYSLPIAIGAAINAGKNRFGKDFADCVVNYVSDSELRHLKESGLIDDVED